MKIYELSLPDTASEPKRNDSLVIVPVILDDIIQTFQVCLMFVN
jgi:hypothetical protein